MTESDPVRLGSTGTVRLSATAERTAQRAGLTAADALRLAERATAVDRLEVPERWRARARSSGWDLSLQVVREGGVAVIVALTARPHRVGGGAETRHQAQRDADPAKRGRGRPPVAAEDRRDEQLVVRVSPAELEELRAWAAREGEPLREMVRESALRAARWRP